MSFFQDILASLQPRDVAVDPTGKLAPVNKIDLNALSTPGPVTNKIDLNALTAEPQGPPLSGADALFGIDPAQVAPDGKPTNPAHEALFSQVLAAIEQESQGDRAKLVNPPATPEQVPELGNAGVVEQLASAPPPKGGTSATKTGKPGSGSAGTSAKDKELEAMLASAGKTNDRSGERGDLVNKQANLLARAEGEKELSDEEKIAIALLGTLPGLVGAIGGGAIAGGYGAAAGAAGGLQGGAMGVNSIAEAKQARRKEAKGEAQTLAERIAKLDDMMAAEKTRAADKQLEISLSERAAKRADARAAEDRKQSWAIANLNNASAMQRALLDANTATQKALLAAKQSGGELKEYQGKATQFATSMLMAKSALDKMTDPSIWNTMRTWSGLQSALSDPKRQAYARAAVNFLEPAIRDVSGAAFGPVEWETKAQQYLPMWGSSPEDIEAAKQYRDSALYTMLEKAGPGRDIAIRSWEQATQQKTPELPTQSSPEHVEALNWAKSNPTNPDAQAILRLHGLAK